MFNKFFGFRVGCSPFFQAWRIGRDLGESSVAPNGGLPEKLPHLVCFSLIQKYIGRLFAENQPVVQLFYVCNRHPKILRNKKTQFYTGSFQTAYSCGLVTSRGPCCRTAFHARAGPAGGQFYFFAVQDKVQNSVSPVQRIPPPELKISQHFGPGANRLPVAKTGNQRMWLPHTRNATGRQFLFQHGPRDSF